MALRRALAPLVATLGGLSLIARTQGARTDSAPLPRSSRPPVGLEPTKKKFRDSKQVVVVVGGGVMGSSVAASVAARGYDVVVVDTQHALRSSWGDTRGLQYGYDGVYLELVNWAARLWGQLQLEHKAAAGGGAEPPLFFPTPNVEVSASRAEALATLERAHARGRPVQLLDSEELAAQFPAVRVPRGHHAVLDPQCIAFSAPDCIAALEAKATRHGAYFLQGETVHTVDTRAREVVTSEGKRIPYSFLVVAAGPWTNKVLDSAGGALRGLPLFVSAEQLLYLRPRAGQPLSAFSLPNMPIIGGLTAAGGPVSFVYCVPHVEAGHLAVKTATHMQGELMHTKDFHALPGASAAGFPPEVFHRRKHLLAHQPESNELDSYQRDLVNRFVPLVLPGLDTDAHYMVCRCLYTSTVDNHFVVGLHPDDGSVAVATAFHGEGFKFAPAIGEVLADLVQHTLAGTDLPVLTKDALQNFSPGRFESVSDE